MVQNLLLGLPTMVLCLLLQAWLLGAIVRYYSRHLHWVRGGSLLSTMMVLIGVMILLMIGNMSQVVIWAVLFQLLGEFTQFSDAVYHSAVNFATLGYGDIVMSEQHRLLGPIQAINGVLMIGVSTATLMSVVQDVVRGTMGGATGKE